MALDLVFRGPLEIKQTAETILRQAMATELVPETYRYDATAPNEKQSKIKIYRTHPQRITFYPTIIISVGNHDASVRAMGIDREIASDQYENNVLTKEISGGYVNIPVIFKIYANRGDDRDALTGILTALFRVLIRNNFQHFAFHQILVGSEQQTVTNNQVIFTQTVTINAHTDYVHVLSHEQAELVGSIQVDVQPV